MSWACSDESYEVAFYVRVYFVIFFCLFEVFRSALLLIVSDALLPPTFRSRPKDCLSFALLVLIQS